MAGMSVYLEDKALDYIVNVLYQRPYGEVFALVESIKAQVNQHNTEALHAQQLGTAQGALQGNGLDIEAPPLEQ